jgi:hypothetical protein
MMSRYGELDLGDLGPAPSVGDWWNQRRYQDADLFALAVDDAPLVALAEADPPEPWGELDSGDRGGGGRGSGSGAGRTGETEVVVARVAVVSARGTGIQLVGTRYAEEWLNVSRYSAVDLSGIQPGDEVEVEVTRAGNGRLYLERLEVLQRRPPYRDGEQ